MEHAEQLARWIRSNVDERPDLLTHLKLQKLAFYCFGACLAFDLDAEVGTDITFEAWEHGPVCRPLWSVYRSNGGNPIPRPTGRAVRYSAPTERVMKNVLDVYGLLPAWLLRQESHLEAPWKVAWLQRAPISNDALRRHFVAKFKDGPVHLPEYLANSSSSALDGIPTRDYRTLDGLAQFARSLRS